MLFETARKINTAQFQKIVFKDWLPSVMGRDLPQYEKFKKKVDLTLSVVFSTAAFRVGHTMVGNEVKRKGPGNVDLAPMSFCDMFFNTVELFQTPGKLESFVRGALGTYAQKVDVQVRDSLRNFLFEKVQGEEGFDLVAMNIQRGRDHALPSYNEVCSKFGIPKAKSFSDISSNSEVQSNLATAYGTVDKVEAWPGMLAEDVDSSTSLPPCILNIWVREFTRLRDGDRFYYDNGDQFTAEVVENIQRVKDLYDDGIDTLRGIIVRNTEVLDSELPTRMFFRDDISPSPEVNPPTTRVHVGNPVVV